MCGKTTCADFLMPTGTLPPNMTGGVANILVDNDAGEVLALWHDK